MRHIYCIALILVLLLSGCNTSIEVNSGDDTSSTAMPASSESTEYIKLGKYIGIEINDPGITEDSIRRSLQLDLYEYGRTVTEGPVLDGDVANIDYYGLIDGKQFNNCSGTSYDFHIGVSEYIDGFGDGLLGADIGATLILKLRFPDDYLSVELAGKDVVYTVTINYVKRYPQLDDAFITTYTNGKYTSLDTYLSETSESKRFDAIASQALSKAVTNAKANGVKYDDTAVQKIADTFRASDAENAKKNGVTVEEYTSMNASQYEEYLRTTAREQFISDAVIEAIALEEKIEPVTQQEYEAGVSSYAVKYGCTSDEFESKYGKDEINKILYFDKVVEFIASKAVIIE